MQHTRRAFVGAIGGVARAGCTGERDTGVEDEVDGGSNQGESESGDDADAPDPEVGSVSLLLNWRISGLHAPYFAALSNGFYEEEGFDEVEIESGQGSDFAAQQVAIGNTEFAISSSDQVLNVGSRELSPRCVGVVMQRNPVVLFSPAGRFDGFEPEALDGVTVGSGPGMVRQMAEAYLEHHGVLEDVEYVDSGFDTVQQLLTGEIDVAGGVFSDVVDAEHQGEEIERLEVGEVIPSYGHQVAVEAGFAEENPETVRSFLRATARGWAAATNDPGEAIDALVARNATLERRREIERLKFETAAERLQFTEHVRRAGWGNHDGERWRRLGGMLAETELLEGAIEPDDAWTNAFLDTDANAIRGYADRR
jgi:NitT/TauT family transport system substrate-binding protein